ncbi:MAG: contractile injection system protein, VgrG/Pvc8 family [Candidatus Thiodiazotropha sp.]
MSVVTLSDASRAQGGFYVPQFEIRIEGVGLPRDVLRDVLQCTYKDSIKEIDSFELTVSNWDDVNNDFKYVGAETSDTLQGSDSHLHRLFEPCNKEVQVSMGYVGDLRTMMTGTFTTMEPSFNGGGAPTLMVRGLNVLHQLRRKQYTTAWTEKKDSEIAENIATLRDRQSGRSRFPLPIVTDANAKADESPIDYVAQRNQYDIDFLLTRARERGYVVFVREGENGRELYFGPSQGGDQAGLRDVTYELAWGRTLMEFKPTLTTANQVKSVTVNGWNRRRRQPISVTVDLNDRRLSRNRDLHELLERCDPREEVVVDEPVFTQAQARQRAIAILQEREKEMVKASATCIGLPDLRAGQRVEISQLGARFSGTYFITETTHTMNDRGYTVRFNARREDESGGGA